jgi:hypothetical protein
MSDGTRSLCHRETLVKAPESIDPAGRRKLLTCAEGVLNSADLFEPRREATAPASGAPVDHAVEGFAGVPQRTFNQFPSFTLCRLQYSCPKRLSPCQRPDSLGVGGGAPPSANPGGYLLLFWPQKR